MFLSKKIKSALFRSSFPESRGPFSYSLSWTAAANSSGQQKQRKETQNCYQGTNSFPVYLLPVSFQSPSLICLFWAHLNHLMRWFQPVLRMNNFDHGFAQCVVHSQVKTGFVNETCYRCFIFDQTWHISRNRCKHSSSFPWKNVACFQLIHSKAYFFCCPRKCLCFVVMINS